MKRLPYALLASLLVLLGSWGSANAVSVFIVPQGGTGTTTAPVSQILYGGGNGVYQSRATTTVSCAGTVSCTTFDILGSSPVTLTGAGGGLTSYDAWTHPTAGQSATTSLMLFNGQASSTQFSAYQAYFGSTATSTFFKDGSFGQASSSPFGFFSINPLAGIPSTGAPAFVIGSSSATSFLVANDGRIGVGTSTIGTGLMGQVNVEAGSKSTALFLTGSNNGYLEANIQNRSNGGSASTDWIATADNGTASAHYVDFGINGSSGGQAPFTTANHAYLYSVDDPINFGSLGTAPFMTWNIGGGTSAPIERARATLAGWGIGTTTPQWTLNLASSTKPQLTLSDGTVTGAPFNLRTNGVYFTISTSSPITFATTSTSIFQLDSSTASTSAQKLSVSSMGYIQDLSLGTPLTVPYGGTGASTLTGVVLGNGTSAFTAASTQTCTNQFVRVMSSSYVATCATVSAADVSLANLTATNATLTFSGTYNGSTARTIGLNLGNANTWTARQTFNGTGVGSVGIVTGSLVGIGTTTPFGSLTVASSTGSQLILSNGIGKGDPTWFMRVASSTLYIGTTTVSNATTTIPALTIQNSGFVGFGTSTPFGHFSFDAGLVNATGPILAIGSSTATQLLIDGAGRIGLGTSSPSTLYGFSVASSTYLAANVAFGLASTSAGSASPFTVNWNNGTNQRYLVNGTSAFILNGTSSNPMSGGRYLLEICQDGVGGHAVTFATPEALRWNVGTTAVNTTANTCTDIYMWWNPNEGHYHVVGSSTVNAL